MGAFRPPWTASTSGSDVELEDVEKGWIGYIANVVDVPESRPTHNLAVGVPAKPLR